MGNIENISVKNDELLEGVIVMTAISADGRYLPLPDLDQKIKAVRTVPQLLHTIVVAGKLEHEPDAAEQDIEPPDDEAYKLIKATNFEDLVKQLEDNGGLFGKEIRQQAREERDALWLPGVISHHEIDWGQLYQVPGLRQIDMEKTGRRRRTDRHSGVDDQSEQFVRSSIDGYEEALGLENLPMKREYTANVFLNGLVSRSRQDRSIILGPPGAGKSSFMGWLARNLANATPSNGALRPFPILVRLADWEAAWKDAGKKLPLNKWLTNLTGEWEGTETKKKKRKSLLSDWMKQGRIILLFDGLDEIGNGFFTAFAKTVRKLAKDQKRFVISCRTVTEQRYAALAQPLYYLTSLDQKAQEAYIAAFPWKNADRREAIKAHLPKTHAIAALMSNPQLLAFLCHTADENINLRLPMVRVELIGAMLRTLLEEKPVNIEEDHLLVGKRTIATMTGWLSALAFRLFTAGGKRRMIFPPDELEQVVKEVLGPDNRDLEQVFIEEMRQRGILRRHPRGWFFFHLILQEYLVARELARLIEEDGFDEIMTFAGETKPLGKWLYDWSIEPHWEEVMLLTAGLLKGPADYIEHIANETRDTLFRHRLSLAARMAGEVNARKYEDERLKAIAGNILDTARNIWMDMGKSYSRPMSLNLTIADIWKLITQEIWIGQDNGEVERLILDQINRAAFVLWRRPDKGMNTDPIFRKGLLSKTKLRSNQTVLLLKANRVDKVWDGLVIQLTDALRDDDWEVSSRAAEAIGIIRPGVLHEDLLSELRLMMDNDKNGVIRYSAVVALGNFAPLPSISQEKLIDSLATISVCDSAPFVREAAIYALTEVLQETSTKEGVAMFLLQKLEDPEISVRVSAAQALRVLGAKSSLETTLQKFLETENNETRGLAALALASSNKPSTQTAVISALLPWLDGENTEMQIAAAEAIGELGQVADREDVILALLKALDHEDRSVRVAAVSAIQSIGPKIAQEKVIYALKRRLDSDDWQLIRFRAANILKEIGQMHSKRNGVVSILKRQGDNDTALQTWADSSNAKSCSMEVPKGLLAALLKRLDGQFFLHEEMVQGLWATFSPWKKTQIDSRDIGQRLADEWFVREWITKSLGSLEPKVVDSNQIKSAIELCLSECSAKQRRYLIKGLSKFGIAANRKPISSELKKLMSIRYGLRTALISFVALRKIRG